MRASTSSTSLLACLVVAAIATVAAAHQPLEHSRSLLQNSFNPNERQYMQITVSLDATCAQVAATSGPAFLNAVKLACLEDTRIALEANPAGIADMGVTLKSVRSMPPNCTDIVVRAAQHAPSSASSSCPVTTAVLCMVPWLEKDP
jgi:hypothetical protein